MIDYIIENWISILFWGGFIGIIAYLILQRINDKEKENFEKRNN